MTFTITAHLLIQLNCSIVVISLTLLYNMPLAIDSPYRLTFLVSECYHLALTFMNTPPSSPLCEAPLQPLGVPTLHSDISIPK